MSLYGVKIKEVRVVIWNKRALLKKDILYSHFCVNVCLLGFSTHRKTATMLLLFYDASKHYVIAYSYSCMQQNVNILIPISVQNWKPSVTITFVSFVRNISVSLKWSSSKCCNTLILEEKRIQRGSMHINNWF